MAGPNEITSPQLFRLIGTPQTPVVIDICLPEQFDADPHLIPTAYRF